MKGLKTGLRLMLLMLIVGGVLEAQQEAKPKKLSKKEKQELAKQNKDAKKAKKAAEKIEIDSTYIDPLSHRFQVKFFGSNNYNQINIKNTERKSYVNYNANITPVFGVGIKIKKIIIQAAFWKPFREQDISNKGLSTYRDIQVYINGRKSLHDICIQSFEGYYLSNSYSIFDTWSNSLSNYRRPDLRVYALNYNTIYNILSKNFSFKAAFSESERQIKSAGSPLCAFGLSYTRMIGDSLIIPSYLSSDFNMNDAFLSSSSYSLHTGIGYAYTFVFLKSGFVSLAAVPQANFQLVSFSHGLAQIDTKGRIDILAQARASIGVNTKRFYIGLSMIYNLIPNGDLGKIEYHYNYGIIKASVIHRFALKKKSSKKQ